MEYYVVIYFHISTWILAQDAWEILQEVPSRAYRAARS